MKKINLIILAFLLGVFTFVGYPDFAFAEDDQEQGEGELERNDRTQLFFAGPQGNQPRGGPVGRPGGVGAPIVPRSGFGVAPPILPLGINGLGAVGPIGPGGPIGPWGPKPVPGAPIPGGPPGGGAPPGPGGSPPPGGGGPGLCSSSSLGSNCLSVSRFQTLCPNGQYGVVASNCDEGSGCTYVGNICDDIQPSLGAFVFCCPNNSATSACCAGWINTKFGTGTTGSGIACGKLGLVQGFCDLNGNGRIDYYSGNDDEDGCCRP